MLDNSYSIVYADDINQESEELTVNTTQEHITKVARETEALKKEMLSNGYRVRSDFGGMLTMTLQEWPHKSIVIDRSKGYIVETIYPES